MDHRKYSNTLQDLLSGIVHGSVVVTEQWKTIRYCKLKATCHDNEVGLILGKDAKTIKAIQLIFKTIADQWREQIKIIVEGFGGRNGNKSNGFKTFDQAEAILLFSKLLHDCGVDYDQRTRQVNGGIALVVPKISAELSDAFNTVMEAYGKNHQKIFGLVQ